ncbi:MAG: outer membrane beta-barrel protein [Prevotella sp.]|nr:outer membrane beta-barrel protein [Prevotella sp.]MBQ9187249.1 outer membrane beta-barrel protein [Prevotella sp.]
MKKIAFVLVALLMSVAANAQFEKGKGYLGASLSGIDLSSQAKQFHFGLDAKAGYLFADNLMATAQIGYNHLEDSKDTYMFGVGARYYIIQNGLYLGASAKFKHAYKYNDFLPGVQIGYAFFLSRTVTIEPELYMDFSTKKFDYSCYGLGIGIGVYLFKDQYKIKR